MSIFPISFQQDPPPPPPIHTHTLYFYMFLSCVGCQGGLDRGSGHRQRSGVRLPPTSHRCSPAIAGESLSPITGCQRARFTTHRCSSAVAGEWFSPVTGCQGAVFTTHRCSSGVTGEWLSPVTGCQRARFTTHQCSRVVTCECHNHRVSKGRVHHSPVFTSCHR